MGPGSTGHDGIAQEQIPGTDTPLIYTLDMPSWSAVRTARYLYVRWYELYDLRADPYQLTNLIKTPEGRAVHADLVATLDRRPAALTTCSGATCR